MVGFNFAARDWAFCNGQTIAINQNQSLYSLFGTIYGGDGRTSFGLPDLRGRTPIHVGQGAGLSPYSQGSSSGNESIPLMGSQVPTHYHMFAVSNGAANQTEPNGHYFTDAGARNAYASAIGTSQQFNPSSVTIAGQGVPHNNMMPFLVVNYTVATAGLYPSRS